MVKIGASRGTEAALSANSRFLTRQLTILAEEGGDVDEVLRWAGIDCRLDAFLECELQQTDNETLSRLSAHTAVELANINAVHCGRPMFRGSDWGLLVYCLISGPSLRASISRACDFFHATDGRFGTMDRFTHGEETELRFDPPVDPSSRSGFLASLFGMMNMHGLLGWLIDANLQVVATSAYVASMRDVIEPELLPFPIKFGAEQSALFLPSAWLDHPVVRKADEVGARPTMSFTISLGRTDTLTERARRIMFDALRRGDGPQSLDQLADELRLPRETFRRRLRASGSSYNLLKDSCRRELALELLYRTELSVEEISDRVFFCDSDEFRRAVHRWIGISPSAYRRGRRANH